MRKLSAEVYNRYASLILPQKTHQLNFNTTVAKLKQYFGRTQSQFSLRMDCMNMTKEDADDFVTHAGKVNKLVEDGRLQEMSNDQ